MSPISNNPAKRQRQLTNLKRGSNPAPADNSRARTHGAYAAIAVERLEVREREVFEALAADAPLRDSTGGLPHADGVVVRLLAEVLIRLEDLGTHLRQRGVVDRKGKLRPAVEIESRLRREAADHADALGMTPRSRARLGLDLARTTDLAVQWAAEGDGADDHPASEQGDAVIEGEATDA